MTEPKSSFYGKCLPGRKRHYFGRNNRGGGGMGQPNTYRCLWCGKYNPKWEPRFWEEEAKPTEVKEAE